jgi:hypothetical protein
MGYCPRIIVDAPGPIHTSGNTANSNFAGGVWRAPLVPVALATTAGMIADRYASLPFLPTLMILLVALVSGAVGSAFGKRGWPFVLLLLGCVAAGAAWHHYRRDIWQRFW